ncbi:MAG: PhzF family phenazine biosynthesis protein [Oscillospiraceae bacterium]
MEAYVMDAFSARLFGGNQAGVVLPDRPLDDAEMQQIAAEFKHSETAFVTRSPDGSVILRYFTPAGRWSSAATPPSPPSRCCGRWGASVTAISPPTPRPRI